jgi:hypothetical protein
MPGQHAVLSPSSAERWIACPASVALSATMPVQAESGYAREGTAAHALGEIKASLALGQITDRQAKSRRAKWAKEFEEYAEDPETMIEMEEHTDAYVALIQERAALYPNSQVMLEQRMSTGLPDGGKGTSDTVIASPQHIEIIDFKYGQGVTVEAHGNPQLRLYAFGALEAYGDLLGDTEVVRITVHQPRLDHILTEEITPDALREWHATVALPAAEEALGDDAHFGPSDEACRWCPASGRCRAQLEAVFADDPFDAKPDLLEPAEMAEVLGKVPLVREWLKAFEEAALDTAYSQGKRLPGYKVVLSGGKRAVKDNDAALDTLVEAGYDKEEVAVLKVKGIGDLEKLLGKEQFKALLEDSGIVQKGEGKPALVLESDKRPAIAPNSEAAREFADADGEDLL